MKRYEEIANAVFKRREEYLAKQKKKKRVVLSLVASTMCAGAVLTITVGLWAGGVFRSQIPVTESSAPESADTSSTESDQHSTTATTPSKGESTSAGSTATTPSRHNDSTTQDEPDDTTSSPPTYTTPSTNPPTSAPNNRYFIDSFDKMNFYSAKRIINDNALLPFGMSGRGASSPKVTPLSIQYKEYPIERNKMFTISMVTYFSIELQDEEGFLAQKLGGTGVVEVVVTENDIEDLGQMITFKRGERYYSCLLNRESHEQGSEKMSRRFSSHKYIDGFNLVKNLEQENYQFVVHYDGSKVVGFECQPFSGTLSKYQTDSVTLVEDMCIVLYTKRNFTIDQLEMYFKNGSEEASL